MRKSAGKIFAVGLLKSFLFFVLFAAISMISYRLIIHFYGIEDMEAVVIIPPLEKDSEVTEARIDGISRHLIYCVDEDTGEINKLLLEIFNSEKHELYYITIPIKTQLTLSDALHRQLVLIKPSMPGFLKLSAITGYFPKETAYDYGVRMVEDMLNIELSYYSVVPQSIYETVFETEAIKDKADNKDSEKPYPREMFSDEFVEFLHTIKTETQLRSYIEELYTGIISNLSFEDKLNYMEGYLNTSGKDIIFEVIAGKDSNSAFVIDERMAAKQLKIWLNE